MDWLSASWISALVAVPFLGVLFLLFIPDYEDVLRRKVSLFVILIYAGVLLRNSYLLFLENAFVLDLAQFFPLIFSHSIRFSLDTLSALALAYLIIGTFFFLFTTPLIKGRKDSGFDVEVLIILGLSSFGFLAEDFLIFLLVQYAVILILCTLNYLGHGAYRSSSTLSACVFFTAVDLGAFFVWSFNIHFSGYFPGDFFNLVIILPFLTRLTLPFFAPWSRLFFANSNPKLLFLYLISGTVAGGLGLARAEFASPFLMDLVSIAAIFGALLSFFERTITAFLMRVVSVMGCLVASVFLSNNKEGFPLGMILLGTSSLISILFTVVHTRIESFRNSRSHYLQLRSQWVILVLLFVGVPYIGVGATLWKIFPFNSIPFFIAFGLLSLSLGGQIRWAFIQVEDSQSLKGMQDWNPDANHIWTCIFITMTTSLSLWLIFSQTGLLT